MKQKSATMTRLDLDKREQVMLELNKAGIPMKVGSKKPAHGIYSGIIDFRNEKLIVRI